MIVDQGLIQRLSEKPGHIANLMEIGELSRIFENFSKITNLPSALLDMDGNVLIACNWQDSCTKFHRVNEKSCQNCLESDTALAHALEEGHQFNVYHCKNGLVDVATPVRIDGNRVANLYVGQFFFEAPDLEKFHNQAILFGYDEAAYLEAIQKVPVYSKEDVIREIEFLVMLAELIGNHGAGKTKILTAKKDYKERLQNIEETFNAFISMAPVGVAKNSMDGKFQEINEAIAKMTGYTKDELNDLTYWDLTPRKYESKEQVQLHQLNTEGRYGPYEKEYIHKDGHRVPVLLSGIKLTDHKGEEHIWSVVEDLSAKKSLQQYLKNTTHQNATRDLIFNQVTMEISKPNLSLENCFKVLIEKICKNLFFPIAHLHKISEDKMDTVCSDYWYKQKNINDSAVDDLVENVEKYSCIKGEGASCITLTNENSCFALLDKSLTKPEGINITGSYAMPIKIGEEMVAIAEFFCIDVKQQDKGIIKLLNELTTYLAAPLQAKKHQEELASAKVVADAANKAKTQFLTTMSHEIRSPLNGIIGALEILNEERLTAELKDLIHVALLSADTLTSVIGDVLDYSKIDAGAIDLEVKPFDMDEVIHSVERTMALKAQEKGLSLSFDTLGLKTKQYEGDVTRIKQILLNLISNSIKFTDKGSVKCILSTSGKSGGYEVLEVFVKDTGIGMSEAQLSKIFAPFKQADASTTRKYGGTGLGLSITKSLIEMMGGEITMQSAEGMGCISKFNIKLKPIQEKITEPTKAKEMNMANKKVLLVEDNEINRKVMEIMLEKLNIEYEVARDGIEALASLRAHAEEDDYFSILLVDCQMPNMDGFEMTERVRRGEISEFYKSAPIVAVTANATEDDRVKCHQVGMDDFVTKPINMSKIAEVFNKWL